MNGFFLTTAEVAEKTDYFRKQGDQPVAPTSFLRALHCYVEEFSPSAQIF
jgi:hypothetical protein